MMKIISGFFLFGLIIILLESGCKHDPLIYPASTSCDSTNVSFKKSVLPLLIKHCSTCHGSAVQTHGIILDNYENVKIFALEGSLYGAIIQNGDYAPMPYNSARLDACSISTIHHWILEGIKNN